jgi:hypothetical protein
MMIAHSNICWRFFNTSLFLWMAANRKVNYLEAQFRERHHRMLLKKEGSIRWVILIFQVVIHSVCLSCLLQIKSRKPSSRQNNLTFYLLQIASVC